MPRYDYECQVCGHAFEAFQHMHDPAMSKCSACGQDALVRLIGVPAIRTSTTSFSGRGTLLQQFDGDEKEAGRVVAAARKQGYNPSIYDIYEPCLADRCGDPKAFLPQSDPIGKLKQVCETTGRGAEGRGVSIKSKAAREPRKKKAATAAA
jgi:putative FmdB family regulatory protein